MPKSLNIFAAVTVTALALSLAGQPARASVINWGSATNIVNQNDVDTTGTLFASANFYQTGTATGGGNVTVNGVQFDGFGGSSLPAAPTATPGPSTLTVGNITLTGTSNEANYGNLLAAAVYGGPASYNGLLNQGAYLYNGTTTGTMGFSIGGLTPGAEYLIQYWVQDGRNIPAVWTRTTIVGGVTLDFNVGNTSGGFGQYVTGTFTADSATQAFNAVAGNGGVAQANAMQVRMVAVPEPTQMVFAAGVGAALGAWRLRKLRRNGRGSNATEC